MDGGRDGWRVSWEETGLRIRLGVCGGEISCGGKGKAEVTGSVFKYVVMYNARTWANKRTRLTEMRHLLPSLSSVPQMSHGRRGGIPIHYNLFLL